MEEIFDLLRAIHPLPDHCLNYLRKIVRSKKIRKKELLLKLGEVNKHLYFIKKGALKCYYFHEDKAVCDWFFFENETVVSIGSFYDQLPSEDCIEAVEDTEVFYITKEDYDYLCITYLEFSFVARVLLEKYLKIFHAHARLIRKQSPFEKYQSLLAKMPQLLLRINGQDLASWLNMASATFSRKRGDLG